MIECEATVELDHTNLVKGYAYEENDEEFVIYMEVIEEPTYFTDKLEIVK